jgi:DNA-binding NarL/FixJ family response regulator
MTGRGGCRIALVEDHLLFAESLEIALSMEGNEVRRIPLAGNTRSVITLLPQVLRVRPQIVLLDLDLGAHGNGVQLIEPLSRAGVAVIVVTGNTDKVQWGECLRYGARTVLAKTTRLNDILASVRRINNGLPVVKPEEREKLIQEWHTHRVAGHELRSRLERLTHREQEVLGHLMLGHQVRDIAAESVVSEATVRTQVKSILAKLEVGSQLAAVGVAHQAGWRPPPQSSNSRAV